MKKIVGLGALLMGVCFSVFSQVDTSYIYSTSKPYGTLDLRIAKSATRFYYLQENVTFSYRESSPGVRSTTYRDMTSWDSSPYKQGNLREKNGSTDLFVMNYRILFPQGYQPAYNPGYPIIIMLHGAGEAGNCWGNNCYWATPAWEPNKNDPPAPSTLLALLNNDRNLFHGGQIHMNAVKAAGSKLPNDPALQSTAFPGFVLFPQSLTGWSQPSKVEDAIRLLRLIIKKYNIDENRVYIHGLSNGGGGVNQALKRAPWLFACSATMSAIHDGQIVLHDQLNEAKKLPMWIFQGGQDTNPTPSRTFSFVKKLRDAGADVRYYLYPELGHGTWNAAYKEPDFFPWILSKRKYNPHISYGNPVICNTTGAGVKLSFSAGFFAYQWEKDGLVLNEQTNSEYVADTPGVYRGRFSRKPNPTADDWEPWSDPITVSEVNPLKPSIKVIGSSHLRGPGLSSTEANNTIGLESNVEAGLYDWYRNGELINFPSTDIDDTLKVATVTSATNAGNGTYTLVIKHSYCPSPPSDPVYLFFGNSAPQNIVLDPARANFRGKPNSSSVFLTWNDALDVETGYEIWRRKSGTAEFRFVAKTHKDAISYLDKGLEPNTTYEYKMRAVNNSGRSNYIPSDELSSNYQVTTQLDNNEPTPPQNLKVVSNDINAITVSWTQATDDNGVKEYILYYGDQQIAVPAATTRFTITGLPSNTVYRITVKARDFAGHFSQPSNEVIGTTYVTNLSYKHSTGAWTDLDDSTLVATWSAPEFTGTVNNFTLAPRTQEDFYNFMFNGYLNIQTSGIFIFRTTSDDGSRLLIDGQIVVDNDGKHGTRTVTGDSVLLAAGLHTIELQYFDNTGFQTLTVQYMGPGVGDGMTFVTIPDEVLRSGQYTAPTPPPAPTELAASASGLQRVTLTWAFADDDQTDFEIYRSNTSSGPFQIVARAGGLNGIDSVNLLPDKTYYYAVKTVSASGSSALSGIVSVTTPKDETPPSTPTNLALMSKTLSNVAFSWNASTDNVTVVSYEVYANGQLIGTTTTPSFTANNLSANLSYSFTVLAVDVNGNRSDVSESLMIENSISSIYYSLATGDLNALTSWTQKPDGTGNHPISFSTNGTYFVISNRTSASPGGAWVVDGDGSRVIVPSGVSLTLDSDCTCSFELQGNAVLNIHHTNIPLIAMASPQSTVNYNVDTVIPNYIYGNLNLLGSGIKTFSPDTTSILGNLHVSSGVTVRGSSGNASIIKITGDYIFNGVDQEASTDNALHLAFSSNKSHSIQTVSDLSIFQISLGTNAGLTLKSASQVTLNAGSPNGGGLNLAEGSTMNVGVNNIKIKGRGGINSGGSNGQILISNSNLEFSSQQSEASHIHFDPAGNTVNALEVNTASKVIIEDDLNVTGHLKLKGGELQARTSIALIGTAGSDAWVRNIENNGKISGRIEVHQHLDPQANIWREIGPLVAPLQIQHWQASFPVTGNFSGASSGEGLTTSPSLFTYNSSNSFSAYPSAGSSNTAAVNRGTGYRAYMYQRNGIAPSKIVSTGELFHGDIPLPVKGVAGEARWNFVSNPYFSPVAWDSAGWLRSSVGNVIAVQQNKVIDGQLIGQYAYYDLKVDQGLIPAGSAFWIRSFGAAPALTITESAKTLADSTIRTAEPKQLVVSLRQGNMKDQAFIRFSPSATQGYDPLLDADKLHNHGMFSFSTVVDSRQVAVNYTNNEFCSHTFGLSINNAMPGSYVLEFEKLNTLADISEIILNDKLLNKSVAVTGEPYPFTITTDPASQGSARFTITFSKQTAAIATPVLQTANVCSPDDGVVTIMNSQNGVEYEILNNADQSVTDIVTGTGAQISISISNEKLTAGANTFKLRAGFSGCSTTILPVEIKFAMSPHIQLIVNNDAVVCPGADVTLTASGTPEGGSYQWYDGNEQPIADATSSSLQVQDVDFEKVFYVEAIGPGGCESERKSVHIYPEAIEPAEIVMAGDSLVVYTGTSFQWKKDGEIIAGATQSFYLPYGSGDYSVIVSNGTCTIESAPFSFVVPGADPPGEEPAGEDPVNEDPPGEDPPAQDPNEGANPDPSDPGTVGENPIVGLPPDLPVTFTADVYPVPSDGISLNIKIQTPFTDQIILRIISSSGVTILEERFDPRQLPEVEPIIFTEQLKQGFYYVMIRQGEIEERKKIIVRN